MKILLTGASGFLGQHILRIASSVSSVSIIATAPEQDRSMIPQGIEFVPWDLNSPPANDLFDRFGRPGSVLHLAWPGLPAYRNPLHETEYLEQQCRFLDALIEQGLKSITVTGTCLEYGMQGGMLRENMTCAPVIEYAKGKLALLNHLQEYHHRISLNWLRLFYIYGTGQFKTSLIPQLESALAKGETVFPMSPGDQERDFMPVEEAARIILAIAASNKQYGIINVCSGRPSTVHDFVSSYLESINKKIKLEPGKYPYPDYEPHSFWGDVSKLNFVLNDAKS